MRTATKEFKIYKYEELNKKQYQNHRKVADKLIKNIKEWYMDLCDEYEKWSYNFFYDIEDEDLQEFYDAI